jgi:hypothetical protein
MDGEGGRRAPPPGLVGATRAQGPCGAIRHTPMVFGICAASRGAQEPPLHPSARMSAARDGLSPRTTRPEGPKWFSQPHLLWSLQTPLDVNWRTHHDSGVYWGLAPLGNAPGPLPRTPSCACRPPALRTAGIWVGFGRLEVPSTRGPLVTTRGQIGGVGHVSGVGWGLGRLQNAAEPPPHSTPSKHERRQPGPRSCTGRW